MFWTLSFLSFPILSYSLVHLFALGLHPFFLSLEATSRPRNIRVFLLLWSVWFHRACHGLIIPASDLSPELLWFTSNIMLVPLFSNSLCKSLKVLAAWWISLWRSSSKASWFWMTSNISLESTDVDTSHKIRKTKSCNGVQRPGDRYSCKTSENTCLVLTENFALTFRGSVDFWHLKLQFVCKDFFSTVVET